MTQEAALTACIARECLRHLQIPGILRFFPPTWPSIAIIPDTDVVAALGPLPRFGVKPPCARCSPFATLRSGGSVPAPRPGLEEGSVLYRGSVTTDLLHPP